MIINNTILKSKFEEGDSNAYDYLIDNTETDKQTESLLLLQEISLAIPNDDKDYLSMRNITLSSLGINIHEI